MTSRTNWDSIIMAVPRIPEMFLNGAVGGKQSLNKERSDSFIAFYEFSKEVEIRSKRYLVRIKVGKRSV